ncbi:MAG: metal-dependent hydrolase [Aulosira sp. DedQUE10]|nr:metal-dependent hydrolase [Aulosira sp. DedQUE10]
MSSFIGHSIPAIGLYISGHQQKYSFFWLFWLIVVAWFPDIDYLSPALRPDGMRITHSILFCSILPCLTIILLKLLRTREHEFKFKKIQVILTAFSHLLLDLLVGVGALPLLYPFSSQRFRLPFGLLPSAGKLNLSNYYLYFNLVIEIGVLLPLMFIFIMLYQQLEMTFARKITLTILITISVSFMIWAFSLPR